MIVPTVTADAVTKRGFHNVYRLPAKDSSAGRLFASTALEGKRGVAAIAVAFDGDYGYDVARGFVDQAKANGHPADMLLFPLDKTDPAAAARTVLDRAPGYVFLAGKTAELGPIAEALRLARLRRRLRRERRLLQFGHHHELRGDPGGCVRRLADAAARQGPQRDPAGDRFSARSQPDHRVLRLRLRCRAGHDRRRATGECDQQVRSAAFAASPAARLPRSSDSSRSTSAAIR